MQSMNVIAKDRLKSEITSHPKCDNLNNIDLAVDYIIDEYQYTWNEERQKFMAHYAAGDVVVPDDRTVHDIIESILADPTRACILATRAEVERYQRPKRNPWIRGEHFNLKDQASVFRHEPDLARRWRAEATTVNAQVPR